ncbi:MAG: XRE family transcriptional regulator [Rhodoferax sp.]|nr:XRE family transcriptional regulator [Rhodoferax sp.]MDP3653254.1 XRE family transcriptional regulator [Rhodoferax sp.]
MPKQNTHPADYPQAVIQQIELLAHNIVTARKRRQETQAQWAKRLGVSQPTMARIERGDPSVAMASYVMCMWLINQACGLADLIAPQNDQASLEREVKKARSRRVARAPAFPPKPEGHTAAKRVAEPGISPAQGLASNAQTVAGLAALLSKAEPKPQ